VLGKIPRSVDFWPVEWVGIRALIRIWSAGVRAISRPDTGPGVAESPVEPPSSRLAPGTQDAPDDDNDQMIGSDSRRSGRRGGRRNQ
jgi:hypothetical protein